MVPKQKKMNMLFVKSENAGSSGWTYEGSL